MQNSYAKDYYNTFLKQLPQDYMSARWFSSKATKLDYQQTRRTLKKALGDATFDSVLEIGPGDGVWTDLLLPKTKRLTLLDQSIEMITRAKKRLANFSHIEYVVGDFTSYDTTQQFDLIFAIRCFEYFEDKDAAVEQFKKLLKPGGSLIIVTKNPQHARMQAVQRHELHTGQISRKDMYALLSKHAFILTQTRSATWRFKAALLPLRALFLWLHWLHITTHGLFRVPFMMTPLTESYLYVAKKP